MRYRLRTLIVLTILGPPVLAGGWWTRQRIIERHRQPEFDELINLITVQPVPWKDVGGPESWNAFDGGCTVLAFSDDSPKFDENDSVRFEFKDGMVWVFDKRQAAAP